MFFGQRRGRRRVQRLAAEDQYVSSLFDQLLSRHHILLGFRAGVGVDDSDLVTVDSTLGIGFGNQLFDRGKGGVIGRHVAGLGQRGTDHYFLRQPGGWSAGGIAAAAATGKQDQGEGEGKRGEKLRQNT